MSEALSRKITRKTSWRKYQKKTRLNKQIFLALSVLGLLFILVFLGKFIGFIGYLSQPYSPDTLSKGDKAYGWDGSATINLAIKSDKVYLLSFNPLDKEATLLKIPDETYLSVPLGFGNWPARSIYDLGQAENPPMGARLLKETLSSSFGIPVDGYIIFSAEKTAEPVENILERIRKNPLGGLFLFSQIKTDLSTTELFRLSFGLKGVRQDKLKVVDLEQSNLTFWILLADGSRALQVDDQRLDQFVQNSFADNKISVEGLSIGIFNATDHLGLAEKAARLISSTGGRVVFTTTNSTHQDTSLVFGKNSYTLIRLEQIFAPLCLKQPLSFFATSRGCDKILSGDLYSRADINIILGEDYFKKLNVRQLTSAP